MREQSTERQLLAIRAAAIPCCCNTYNTVVTKWTDISDRLLVAQTQCHSGGWHSALGKCDNLANCETQKIFQLL
mgnify:CR=1 FL=1